MIPHSTGVFQESGIGSQQRNNIYSSMWADVLPPDKVIDQKQQKRLIKARNSKGGPSSKEWKTWWNN